MSAEAQSEGGPTVDRQMEMMRYVYLLQSVQNPQQLYVGSTNDLSRRLAEHNNGKGRHTSRFAPWNCIVALQFAGETKANAFEQYLKTGSGRSFAKRHFW